jgi:hypothetical protein
MTGSPSHLLLGAAIFSITAFSAANAQNCVGIGGSNPTNHPQNFDALGNSSAPQSGDASNITVLNASAPRRYLGKFDNAVADNSNIVNVPGWALFEEGTNVSAVSGRYGVGNGTLTTGNTFSFASTALDGDRAFGSLNDDSIPLNMLGGCFRNTTGTTVLAVRVGYTGELWRLGGSGIPDRLNFQFAVNATDIFNGTFSDVDALDFVTPDLTGSPGARDGNAAQFRTIFPLRLIHVVLAPNDRLYLRWVDSNIAGAGDDGLAIDDFEIQLSAPLAAEVSVSGRVVDAHGAGIAKARIIVTGPGGTGPVVVTNPFGYYRIDNIQAGETYVFTVSSKRHRFADPVRVISVGDEIADVDFVAEP